MEKASVRFTEEQLAVIEALILRQVAAYNQRLFERRLVDFELSPTTNQAAAIREAYDAAEKHATEAGRPST